MESVDAERIGRFLARDHRFMPRARTTPLEIGELSQPGITVLHPDPSRRPQARRGLRTARRVARIAWRSLQRLLRLLRRLG